jgi:glycoside/pentoside/hexuronide:cation symporter, GPH family
LYFQAALLYLFYFYTDVAAISPAWVATIFIVARLIDAASCVILGVIADRTRTRWGRFRPYVLFGSLPLAITALMTFSVVGATPQARIVYATATYTLFSICFAAVAIPYSALLATTTFDSGERTVLGTLRAGFSFSAGIVVSLLMLPLVKAVGGGERGFHLAIGVFAVLATALMCVTFWQTEERAAPPAAIRPQLWQLLRALTTQPLLMMTVVFVLSNIAALLRSTAAIYYFKYNLGRADLVSTYLTVGAVTTVLGIAATPVLSRRIGKKNTMIAGVLLIVCGHGVMSLSPPGVLATFIWIGFFPYLGLGIKAGTTWALLADSVDYAQWRHGTRVEGASYGFAIFGQKLSFALGGAITGWTLSATGYMANVAQSERALAGIFSLVSYYPALFMLIAIVAAVLYPLDERSVAEIQADLAAGKRHTPAVGGEPRLMR